jgi:hypothetical protein
MGTDTGQTVNTPDTLYIKIYRNMIGYQATIGTAGAGK